MGFDMGYFRVATATPRVKIGACGENSRRIADMVREAATHGVEVVVTPELSISGYTCGDLFLQSQLRRSAVEALVELIDALVDVPIVAIVGVPLECGHLLYNCAVAISQGEILSIVPKRSIPNYGEFYEARWFASSDTLSDDAVVQIGEQHYPLMARSRFCVDGVWCAMEICEDLWVANPSSSLMAADAEVFFNLSASPEMVGKYDYLRGLVEQQSARTMAGYVYCSAGSGESSTDLLFAGNGIVAENGRVLASAERFSLEEQLTVADIDVELLRNHRLRTTTFGADARHSIAPLYGEVELAIARPNGVHRYIDNRPFVPSDESVRNSRCREIFEIQSGGLVQRLAHTKCRVAVVGVSGGLDSTLALLVAVRAFDRLGLDRKGIIGVTMPGFGTTGRTYNNALTMMRELGITLREISIKAACEQHFRDIGLSEDDRSVSYENSQARERTQILMDVANMEGGMVIGTGDLSELALGWATYNGDHMSMYGVNGSVPKSLVRYLVRWVADNSDNERVRMTLLDVIDTPVSPELLPADELGNISQKTEDLVGPYELHDFFLYHFVRNGFSPRKIAKMAYVAFDGAYDREVILKWLRTFCRRFFAQQFKRSAMPDGPKVGSVSLSPRGDWRMPSDASCYEWIKELDEE
ncbi:MAG: NAD(+) synthase [Rikenellaceae bacterium]